MVNLKEIRDVNKDGYPNIVPISKPNMMILIKLNEDSFGDRFKN